MDEPLCPLNFVFHYDDTGNVGCTVTAPSFAAVIGCYPELQHTHLEEVVWDDPLWTIWAHDPKDPNFEPWDDDLIMEMPEPAVVERHEWKFT